ncbi:MAG: tryptophan--tRNA ligase, partial [Armatimonadota bacterium]
VYALFSLFADEEEREAMAERYRTGGLGYGDVKKEVFSRFMDHFADARRRRAELAEDMGHVVEVLKDGAERARSIAQKTIARVRKACGVEIS